MQEPFSPSMNIRESQGKQALGPFGVVLPAGGAATTQEEVQAMGERLFTTGWRPVMIKSPNHAGVILNGSTRTAAAKIAALKDGTLAFPKRLR